MSSDSKTPAWPLKHLLYYALGEEDTLTGSEAKIVAYMEGADKRFVIPVYQRNYDWKIENCKQLYDDLVRVITMNRTSHFFGSIVSVVKDGEYSHHLVIDGQQRLTTVSLLSLAMYKLITNGIVEPASKSLPDRIMETILIDKYHDEEEKPCKLVPVKNDQEAYKRLFGDVAGYIPDSNMTINYEYFYDRIQKQEITIDKLFEAISRLVIINITLKQEDDPQLIFESLNSTGLALSEGDKIRNFILMGQPAKQQERFYTHYWNPIEKCTDYDVSSFVRDFLSVKQLSIPTMSKVYFTFKAYVEDLGEDMESLLQELLRYARWYEILLKGTGRQDALDNCIYRLNLLETTVTRPFFLEVLRLQSEGNLTPAEVTEIFHYAENYLFRRSVCSIPTNSLNKTFLMLHHEIVRYDGTKDNYVAKFKYALLSKTEVRRFPDDTEFTEALSVRQVYTKMKPKNKIYLLERLENNNTVEDKNIYRHFEQDTYSIEHIMPQQLTQAWINELGEDYAQIHETWLHRIANLTLTGYNSKYSNSSFAEKRDMEKGFKESGLRLNAWIGRQEHWGLRELEQRNQLLMQTALKTWPLPVTEYTPAQKQFDSCTLEDDTELKGRTIIRFAYMNIEQPVSTWIEMMEAVLKILHAEDKSVLFKLAYNADASNELSAYVSNTPDNLRFAMKIDDNIYVEQNTSTATKISMLRKFFKAYGADTEDLVFYLK